MYTYLKLIYVIPFGSPGSTLDDISGLIQESCDMLVAYNQHQVELLTLPFTDVERMQQANTEVTARLSSELKMVSQIFLLL